MRGLAVEVAIDELLEELRISLSLVTQVSVLERLKVADYAVDGRWVKDTTCFIDSSMLAEAFGRGYAGGGQAIEMPNCASELILVDVHRDIGLIS